MKFKLVERETIFDEDKIVKVVGKFPKTKREALKASIAKWEFIVKSLEVEKEIIDCGEEDTCALCHLYNNDETADNPCVGCPVYDKTGRVYCRGTPFERYYESERVSAAKRNAIKEVKFLKSLLEEKR